MDLFVNFGDFYPSIPVTYDLAEQAIRISIKGDEHTFRIKIEDVESEEAITENTVFHNMYVKCLGDDSIVFAKNNSITSGFFNPTSTKLVALVLPRFTPYDQAMILSDSLKDVKPIFLIKMNNASLSSYYYAMLFEFEPGTCNSITLGFLHAKKHYSYINFDKLEDAYQITRKNSKEFPYYEWSLNEEPKMKRKTVFTCCRNIFSP